MAPEVLTPIQAPTMMEGVTPVAAALAVVPMEAAAAQQEAVQEVKASFAGGNFLVRAGR